MQNLKELTYSFFGKIGFSSVSVTPAESFYHHNWGASECIYSEGIHQDIICAVMAIKQDSRHIYLMMTLDACAWQNNEQEFKLRQKVALEFGIYPHHVLINLSHSHSAVPFVESKNLESKARHQLEKYYNFLEEKLIQASREAIHKCNDVTMRFFYGKCNLAKVRDLQIKGKMSVGLNPDVEADDTIALGKAMDQHGKVVGLIVNYACHPTTLAWKNKLMSPDYVGELRKTLRERYPEAECIFLQGASGELAPAHQYSGDIKVAEQHGRQLGYAALSYFESVADCKQALHFTEVVASGAELACWEMCEAKYSSSFIVQEIEVNLEIKKDLNTTEVLLEQQKTEIDPVHQERIRRRLRVRAIVGNGEYYPMKIQLWKIGDMVFVGIPGEPYSEFQKELRRRFPGCIVFVVGLSNGGSGYLPKREDYEFSDSYTVIQTPFEKGSMESALEMVSIKLREVIS